MVPIIIAAVDAALRQQQNSAANEIAKQQLDLDRAKFGLNLEERLYGIEQNISDLENRKRQTLIDIEDIKTKVGGVNADGTVEKGSFDLWLENYSAMKETELANYEYSGRQQYEGLMSALGYADALAGATGRGGAGTSMALTGGKARADVQRFAGQDMALDGSTSGANAGIYGMNLGQINFDLESQRLENEQQRGVFRRALDIYNQTLAGYDQSINRAKEEMGNLEKWVKDFTGGGGGGGEAEEPAWKEILDEMDPSGVTSDTADALDKLINGNTQEKTEGAAYLSDPSGLTALPDAVRGLSDALNPESSQEQKNWGAAQGVTNLLDPTGSTGGMLNDGRTLANPDSSQEEKINAGLNLTANILTGGLHGAVKNGVENAKKEAEKAVDRLKKVGENLKKGGGLSGAVQNLVENAKKEGEKAVENAKKEGEKAVDRLKKEAEKVGENLKKGWERFTSGDWF